ncbi:hypothetical protein CAEBREN_18541 [Caenorhabditis brenneri]|uniref:Uncharacterized protein n=1 Tax=Caenorhabditis brenneri TaxID=135651 RepID=G0NRB7_CAEBE|nr:hypothetical protein CAEBREN_18541 [Caenorhabditis brenneri]
MKHLLQMLGESSDTRVQSCYFQKQMFTTDLFIYGVLDDVSGLESEENVGGSLLHFSFSNYQNLVTATFTNDSTRSLN